MTANVRVTYDLRTQPWSLGDLLTVLAVARLKFGRFDLVLQHDSGVRPTDFEFVPREPGRHLTLMQEIAESIEGCESVIVSSEPGDWPEDTSQYLFYWLFAELKDGEWPRLECKPQYVQWANAYRAEHGIEGVCHVRRHPHHNDSRDSCVLEWGSFFSGVRSPIALIGDVPELAGGNIVLAPPGVGNQLALAQTADWYMGASSGPCTMVVFGGEPYRIFNRCAPQVRQFDGGRFIYGPPNKWLQGPETASLLSEQHSELHEMVMA